MISSLFLRRVFSLDLLLLPSFLPSLRDNFTGFINEKYMRSDNGFDSRQAELKLLPSLAKKNSQMKKISALCSVVCD
jgi:hypothetical protein